MLAESDSLGVSESDAICSFSGRSVGGFLIVAAFIIIFFSREEKMQTVLRENLTEDGKLRNLKVQHQSQRFQRLDDTGCL